MQKLFVHVANYLWLVVVLVGVPAITGVQFGGIGVSATKKFQLLTLGGLGTGMALNFLGACVLRNKSRNACLKWAIAQGAILATFYFVFGGYIHFGWLKETLLWLKSRFS